MDKIALKSGYYFLPAEKSKIPFFEKLVKVKDKVKIDNEELEMYDAFDIKTSKEVDDFFGNHMGFYIDDYLINNVDEEYEI